MTTRGDDRLIFVWRESQRGEPRREVWFGEKTNDNKPVPTLARHVLTDEQAFRFRQGDLSLADLAALYPPPELSS